MVSGKFDDVQMAVKELEKEHPCPDALLKYKVPLLYKPICIQTLQKRLLRNDGESPVYLYHDDYRKKACQWVVLPCANGKVVVQSLFDSKVLHVTFREDKETWFVGDLAETKESQFTLDQRDNVYKGKPYTVYFLQSEVNGEYFQDPLIPKGGEMGMIKPWEQVNEEELKLEAKQQASA